MPSVSFKHVLVPASSSGRSDHDFDFSVNTTTGTVVGVLGERGSGAELVLDLLCDRTSPAGGGIEIGGGALRGNASVAELPLDHASLPDHLTVEEVLTRAALVAGRPPAESAQRLIAQLGLEGIRGARIAALDPFRSRLVGIASAMVPCPEVFVCPNPGDGLIGSERARLWKLFREIARANGCAIFQLARDVDQLRACDSVVVLRDGRVIYHAPPHALPHYFGIGDESELFTRLEERPTAQWQRSWERHRESYQEAFATEAAQRSGPPPDTGASGPLSANASMRVAGRLVLDHARRLARSRPALGRAAAVPLAFLPIVALFSRHGRISPSDLETPAEAAAASLSLFVLLVVVFAVLAGTRNGIREIAGEREVYRREHALGLDPGIYVLSKSIVLAVLAIAQSLWMLAGLMVFCRLPASPFAIGGLLVLANLAGGALALALSAAAPSVLIATRCGAYFVGTQVLLSGALLALPRAIELVIRPVISAFWAWSGILHDCARHFPFFGAAAAPHPTAPPGVGAAVLLSQALAGMLIAWLVVRRSSSPCTRRAAPRTARPAD